MKRTNLVFLVLAGFVVLALIPKPAFPVSETTIGLNFTHFDQNEGNYAKAGNYYIFATLTKLLFYDYNATLLKTWDLPSYYAATTSQTSIIDVNSTHILIAHRFYNMSLQTTSLKAWLLYVPSLTYTTIFNNYVSPANTGYSATYGQALINMSGTIYIVFPSITLDDYAYFYELFPTAQFKMRYNSSRLFWGQTFLIPSSAEQDTFYALTRDSNNSTRYHIYKIDLLGTTSVTDIGQGGTNWDYGNPMVNQTWVYFVNSIYQNISGSSYYTVMIAYTYGLQAEQAFALSLVRWNDTYIFSDTGLGVEILGESYTPPIARIFSVVLPSGESNPYVLADGSYRPVYLNGVDFRQWHILLSGLNTLSPTLTVQESGPITYQNKQYVFYPTEVGYQAGIQPPLWTVMFQADLYEGRAAADKFNALSTTWSISYTVTPNATISFPSSNWLTYAISKVYMVIGKFYTWTITILANGVNDLMGTFVIYSNSSVAGAGIYYSSGTVTNGVFSFSAYSIDVMNSTAAFLMRVYPNNYLTEWIEYYIEYQFGPSGEVPTPTPWQGGPLDIENPLQYGTQLAVSIMIPFLFLVIPALVLVKAVGKHGLIIGFIIGAVSLGFTGMLPLWSYVLIGFGILSWFWFGRG